MNGPDPDFPAGDIPRHFTPEILIGFRNDKNAVLALKYAIGDSIAPMHHLQDDHDRHACFAACNMLMELDQAIERAPDERYIHKLSYTLPKPRHIGWALHILGEKLDRQDITSYARIAGEKLIGPTFADREQFQLPFSLYRKMQHEPVPAKGDFSVS